MNTLRRKAMGGIDTLYLRQVSVNVRWTNDGSFFNGHDKESDGTYENEHKHKHEIMKYYLKRLCVKF